MSQRVNFSGKVKSETDGAEAKASLNRAFVYSKEYMAVAGIRHETMRATHGQVEAGLISCGGPNPPMLQNWGMTCG